MLFLNTKMPLSVAIVVVVEIAILYNQLVVYRARPNEGKRLYHFLILLVLALFNIAEGFFPDPHITSIPIILQNFLGYAFGYVFAACCPIYFYKTMDLPELRFHGKYGFFFIILPVLVFYWILYPINQDLAFTRKYVYILPQIYATLLFGIAMSRIIRQYKSDNDKVKLHERLCIYCSIIPVMLTPILGGWLGAPKSVVTPVFNIGFLVANTILMRNLMRQSREKYNNLKLLVLAKDEPTQNKGSQTGPIEISVFDEEEIDEKKYQFIKLKLEEVNQGPCDLSHQFIKQDTGYLLSTKHNCIYSFCLVSEKLTILNSENIVDFKSKKEPYITSNNDRVRYTYRIIIVLSDPGTKPLVINPFTEEEYENWYAFVTQIYKQKEDTRAFVQGNDNIVQVIKGSHGVNKVEYM